MRLIQVTQPSIEPVTLDQAKAHLRIPSSFTTDDVYITSRIATARRYCESRSHLCFINQTWTMYMDTWHGRTLNTPGSFWGGNTAGSYGNNAAGITLYNEAYRDNRVDILHGPISSITSVQYVDTSGTTQTLDTSVYFPRLGNPGGLGLNQYKMWPLTASQVDSVQITYVAGYGTTADSVPGPAIDAILQVVERLYEYRGQETTESLSEVGINVDDLLNSIGCGNNLFM